MKRPIILSLVLFLSVLICFKNSAQSENSIPSNIVYGRFDYHFQVRDGYGPYGSPELSIGYDRKIFGRGISNIFVGLRTGLYYEIALTALDYEDTYHHPFVGLYPSYVLQANKWLAFQFAGSWDIIFETHEDIDDFWWWSFGFEPSVQFYPVKGLFLSVGPAVGIFPWFEGPVTYNRYFIKAGVAF